MAHALQRELVTPGRLELPAYGLGIRGLAFPRVSASVRTWDKTQQNMAFSITAFPLVSGGFPIPAYQMLTGWGIEW